MIIIFIINYKTYAEVRINKSAHPALIIYVKCLLFLVDLLFLLVVVGDENLIAGLERKIVKN